MYAGQTNAEDVGRAFGFWEGRVSRAIHNIPTSRVAQHATIAPCP